MAAQQGLTAGQAAQAAGLSRKAMRIYEEKGLIAPAARTESGYRLYSDDDIAVLRFIRCTKKLGLRLEDIATAIEARSRPEEFCAVVKRLLDARLSDIDEALGELSCYRRRVVDAADRCNKRSASTDECPIFVEAVTRSSPGDCCP